MTNQKTIERLKAVRNYLCAGNPIWDVNEMRDVFELAISALQAQDSPKPKAESVQNVQNEDLISRKAAIDVLATMQGLFTSKAALVQNSKIWQQIKDLPSAQPETAKRIVGKSRNGMTLWYQCFMCNEPVDAQDNFCRGCGRRLTDG